MAFPVVEATAESATSTAGTSHAVTLPSNIASTDGVLITMDIGSTSATMNALTDWTEILDENAANGLKIWWYTGTGVPSNPTFTSSASTRDATISWRISNVDRSVNPQIGTTATGTSATPDPPASAAPGSTKDFLFIAFAGMAGEEADDDTWGNTPPTNYTPSPPLQKSCGVAGTNLGGLIVAASRQLNTGSAENPGTFGVDVSAAWRAQTVMVHPDARTFVSGGVASEADSVPAGQVLQVYTAQPAPEADTVPAGQAAQVYTAGPASEADSVPAGTVDQGSGTTVNGGVAAEADTVPAGKVLQTYTASPAAESDSVPSGRVAQVYTSSPAGEHDSVPAGLVRQLYPAGVASEADAVPAGRVLQVYTSGPAFENDTVPAGTVFGPILVLGGVATEQDTVPAGAVLDESVPATPGFAQVAQRVVNPSYTSHGPLNQMRTGFQLVTPIDMFLTAFTGI